MSTKDNRIIQPYLFFDGRCEQALEFYRRALGAEVIRLLRVKDSPEPPPAGTYPPDSGNKIMHAQFRVGATTVMASDGHCAGKPVFHGFSLALSVATEADADQAFAGLTEGGQVQMPPAKTFFSKRFGMVTDRFGVMWMIMVMPEGNAA
jgi:PhnB protein